MGNIPTSAGCNIVDFNCTFGFIHLYNTLGLPHKAIYGGKTLQSRFLMLSWHVVNAMLVVHAQFSPQRALPGSC